MNTQVIEKDINQEYVQLHLERQKLVDKRLDLLAELRSISQIKASFSRVVSGRYMTKSENIPSVHRWTDGIRELHQLFKSIQSDLLETRLELEQNQAETQALRKNGREL